MSTSNIWTAASEGNLQRVVDLIEHQGISPNAFDENSYTPIHASASWSHPEVLRYLISKGGNINLVDQENENCLFVVEIVEMAKLIVEEFKVDFTLRNSEGLTAAEHLMEDYPEVSLYLQSLTSGSTSTSIPTSTSTLTTTTEAANEDAEMQTTTTTTSTTMSSTQPDLDTPTDALLSRVRDIMQASERGELSESETDDRLRVVVEEAVAGQVEAGKVFAASAPNSSEALVGSIRARLLDANGELVPSDEAGSSPESKRSRMEIEGKEPEGR